MESKANYTIVGLFVLILAAGLVCVGIWLSIGFNRKQYNTYVVYMHESVSGLSQDSLVKYNGVKVGEISEIALSEVDPQEVRIVVQIDENTPITTSTRATLISQGITGTTYLGLTAISSTYEPLQKTPGEPFPVIPYEPSFFYQLERNISVLTHELKRMLDKKNAKNLAETIDNIAKVTTVFAENSQSIAKSLQDLPKLIEGLKNSADKFNVMAERLSTAGASVTATMKASKNTVNKISQQTLPPMNTMLQRLDLIAANLEQVSADS